MSVHVFYVVPVLITALVVCALPVHVKSGVIVLSAGWRVFLGLLVLFFVCIFIADSVFGTFSNGLLLVKSHAAFYISSAIMLSIYIREHGGYVSIRDIFSFSTKQKKAKKSVHLSADAPDL